MSESSEIAEIAARYVNSTDRHIFLTGKAGTGKTTFLRNIVKSTHKNTVVAAPTGIAAINAGGVTLHSLLQLPFGAFIPENIPPRSSQTQINTPSSIGRDRRMNSNKRRLLQEIELLIIDEVSMLRADLLDCIDHTLRYVRRRNFEPFGGLQVLFIGDLMQLPPVVKDDEWELLKNYYDSPYFFEAHVFKENQPIRVELNKIYRQSDEKFIDLLNRLRNNEQNEYDHEDLNQYFHEGVENMEMPGYIHLTTHNRKADLINQTRLEQLKGDERRYVAEIDGDFPETMFPTSYALTLKEGAQVMFIKNDPSGEGRFFNGKIGEICDLSGPKVRFSDGQEIEIPTYKWENKRYELSKTTNEIEDKYLGSFEQYPIKLAWAVTIHKSQGLTFEKAILDLAGTFAPGQLYVALSRLTSLNGLVLSSPLPGNPPAIDENLREFSESFDSEGTLKSNLKNDQIAYFSRVTETTFGFEPIMRHLQYHIQSFNKAESRSAKQGYLGWTRDLLDRIAELKKTGQAFRGQVKNLIETENWPMLSERMQKANTYFNDALETILKDIKKHISDIRKHKGIKEYAEEVREILELTDSHRRLIIKTTSMISEALLGREITKDILRSNGYFTSQSEVKKSIKKKPTAEITLELYQQGKSIKEIADERGLVESTITGHLSQFVETGDIEVTHLISGVKLEKIINQYKAGLTRSSEIKEALTDDISYTEIKVGIAYSKWLEEHGHFDN